MFLKLLSCSTSSSFLTPKMKGVAVFKKKKKRKEKQRNEKEAHTQMEKNGKRRSMLITNAL